MGIPVEVAAVDDTAAYAGGVSVHVLGSRMNDDVCSPFERTAVDRSRECIVHNQRHSVTVCDTGKLFDIQHFERRIGDRFSEQCFRIRLESCRDFFFAGIRINECNVDAEFLHGDTE